ncbi:death-associated protein 1 [Trichinella spiralis]|uniref:death-associated protein 1 n=1 Tax=Trichinella spiralis TaxID=6334 RepID=UPI0001EFB59C|nr:death-associated protein 1 [Trichinella spiralis]
MDEPLTINSLKLLGKRKKRDFRNLFLRQVVSGVALWAGYHEVEEDALTCLVDVLYDTIQELCIMTKSYAEHCNRTQVAVSDFMTAVASSRKYSLKFPPSMKELSTKYSLKYPPTLLREQVDDTPLRNLLSRGPAQNSNNVEPILDETVNNPYIKERIMVKEILNRKKPVLRDKSYMTICKSTISNYTVIKFLNVQREILHVNKLIKQ